ncbi:MAG: hypothetical protein JWM86_2094, partial [Thermoleophilia bacterium]|nr:hypothetical protein [Thermoleophilia bacterium]
AIGLGAGVLGARSGLTLLRSTIRDGRGPGEAIRESLRVLGSERRGVGNSLGIGASMTVAPLVASGLLGPVIYNATGSTTAARLGGGGIGAIVTGALLTTLLRGKGGSAMATSVKVAAGAIVGGGLGLLASGVATDALRPQRREYDVARGTTASP